MSAKMNTTKTTTNAPIPNKEILAWSLYYKGTMLQMPFVYKKELINMFESTIINGLINGATIAEQRVSIIEDLDIMEQYICEQWGNKKYDINKFEQLIGKEKYEKMCAKWGINIICALKLKIIKNDNDNGYMFVNKNL